MKNIISNLFKPKNTDPDLYRKELALNSLLAFCFIVLFLFFILVIRHEIHHESHIGMLKFTAFCLPIFASYYFSRTSRLNTASTIFIATFTLGAISAILYWSVFLPAALLSLVLMTVITGVLIDSKTSFLYATILLLLFILISVLLDLNFISHDTTWQNPSPSIGDSIEFGMFILFIAGITWISNTQSENSLRRAKESESELKLEKDLLEVRVAERGKQLEQVQIEKMSEVYKFIEFGKLSSGLIHDLINPLNAICLEIETQKYTEHNKDNFDRTSKDNSIAIKSSVDNLIKVSRKIQNILNTTRRHLQVKFKEEHCNLKDIIEDTLLIHKYRLFKSNITIQTKLNPNIETYGPPSLFTHIITNLISNSIDAINELKDKKILNNYRPIIYIQLQIINREIIIIIKDNGAGIPDEIAEHIFNPFFTTKDNQGCGYGLSASKYMLEKYFNGQLTLFRLNQSYMNYPNNITRSENSIKGSKINKFKTSFKIQIPLKST